MYQTVWINKDSLRLSLSHLGPSGVTVQDLLLSSSFKPGAEHGAASSSPRVQAPASRLPLLLPPIPKPQQSHFEDGIILVLSDHPGA